MLKEQLSQFGRQDLDDHFGLTHEAMLYLLAHGGDLRRVAEAEAEHIADRSATVSDRGNEILQLDRGLVRLVLALRALLADGDSDPPVGKVLEDRHALLGSAPQLLAECRRRPTGTGDG